MEVTVAMLLSAICAGICYTAYGLINEYYRTFQQKNERVDQVLSLKHVLEADFLKSTYVIRTVDGFELAQDSLSLNYLMKPGLILREVKELHTDTFKIDWQDLKCSYENREVQDADTLDHVEFMIKIRSKPGLPVSVNKIYSAQNLFQ